MSNQTHIILDASEQTWLTSKAVQRIFAALPEGSVRFVGGCVRNALLGEPVGDIDLATQLAPKAVKAALDAAKIRNIPTGIDHGTITAVVGGQPFEITSLRKDVETDGRRAVVAFTTDWAEDAQRRDFTMNALYADPAGHVYDPTEQGLEDLHSRKFRFVGDADMRVREDYLRILRYFRFLAWYCGDGKVDAGALKACRENRRGLKSLSAERVWAELKKLLSAPNPARAVRIMGTNDVLETLLPEASNSEGLDLLVALEAREDLSPDPILRLMATGARDEFAFAGLSKRLKVSSSEKSRLLNWAGDRTDVSPDMDEKAKKIACYQAGLQVVYDRAVIRAAGATDPILSSHWMTLACFAKGWDTPVFPLKGRDLKAAGVSDGPEMGRILKALEALWVRSGFTVQREGLLAAMTIFRK